MSLGLLSLHPFPTIFGGLSIFLYTRQNEADLWDLVSAGAARRGPTRATYCFELCFDASTFSSRQNLAIRK
jgi:hypothetical protein